MSRVACAEYLGVSLRTIRYWEAGHCRVPWSVVRLLRFVRQGDLGALGDAWEGFRILRDRLCTPDGRAFPVDALRRWWLTVEQARFWRLSYDSAERAGRRAESDALAQSSSPDALLTVEPGRCDARLGPGGRIAESVRIPPLPTALAFAVAGQACAAAGESKAAGGGLCTKDGTPTVARIDGVLLPWVAGNPAPDACAGRIATAGQSGTNLASKWHQKRDFSALGPDITGAGPNANRGHKLGEPW